LYNRIAAENRILHHDWDKYDTRQVVFKPAKLDPKTLEAGYLQAYKDFYSWGSIFQGAATKQTVNGRLRHMAYAGGWKKFEPMWDFLIRAKKATQMLPVLEGVLSGFGRIRTEAAQRKHKYAGLPKHEIDSRIMQILTGEK
jgi:hypothetical protein